MASTAKKIRIAAEPAAEKRVEDEWEYKMIAGGHQFPSDARVLRDSIIDLIEGIPDGSDYSEGLMGFGNFNVRQELDGTVEFILGMSSNTKYPVHYVKIRIERVDGAPPFKYYPDFD